MKAFPITEISTDNIILKVRTDKDVLKHCEMKHVKPYEAVVQASESVIKKFSEPFGPWREDCWKSNSTEAMVTEIIDVNDDREPCTKNRCSTGH